MKDYVFTKTTSGRWVPVKKVNPRIVDIKTSSDKYHIIETVIASAIIQGRSSSMFNYLFPISLRGKKVFMLANQSIY